MPSPVKPIPDGYHTVTPYLIVEDALAILDFLERAFGATVLDRYLAPDGSVTHAEFRIGDSLVMLGGASAQYPAIAAMLHLYVEDVDAVYRQALAAGATSLREPENMPYGDRSGGVKDPAGNQWWIATHVEDVSSEELARRQKSAEVPSSG